MELAESSGSEALWKRTFRRRLLSWFRRHARDLPWRRTRDPYHVWISEIMLQQTQVATVIPYFNRFIQAFSTVHNLAAASEQQVLQYWEGLGYYRRARQLHRAAQIIVEQFDGVMPTEIDQVRSLPGIGRYTAGAILSISRDARHPILEANTVRLFSRLIGLDEDPTSRSGQERLWEFAEAILPQRGAGEFNQALMELGSLICTPKQPACRVCPLVSICPTHAAGRQHEIPVAKKPKNYESVREVCVAVWKGGKVLLRQCQEGERWAGLWDFPRFTLADGSDVVRAMKRHVEQVCAIAIQPGERITTIKHGVTRFRITLDCYDASWHSGRPTQVSSGRWVLPADFPKYPLTSTARRLSRILAARVSTTAERVTDS